MNTIWTSRVWLVALQGCHRLRETIDQEWLDLYNWEKKGKDGGGDVASPEMFEIVMDQLEKEWFNLVRYI